MKIISSKCFEKVMEIIKNGAKLVKKFENLKNSIKTMVNM